MSSISEILGLEIGETHPPYEFVPFPEGTVMVPFTENLMKTKTDQLVWLKSIVPGHRLLDVTVLCPFTDSAVFKYDHPNCIWKGPKLLEFKRYRSNGSKYWTRKAGMAFYFLIPESKIKIYLKEDFSYPDIDIDGTHVQLSCSAGGGEISTSWISDPVSTMTYKTVAEIKAIAKHSVPNLELKEKLKAYKEDENDRCVKHWQKVDAAKNTGIQIGDKIVILSEYGVEHPLTVNRIDYKMKLKKAINGKREYGSTKSINGFATNSFYIKARQVDWVATKSLKAGKILEETC